MTRKMKDSGIEWIGEIPEEWEVVPARYFFKANKKIVGRKENEYERLSLTMKGVLKKSKYNSEGLQPSNFNSYQILTKNQIVFKLIDLQNVSTSRVGISPYKGIVSPAYIIIDRKGTKTNNRFYYYWYMSMYLNKVFNLLGDAGVRSNINATELLELKVPRTSFREQNIISNFLDKKTEQIEDIKSTIMKEIQTLEDYKKSVITEAVTKGLDKNVEMKDSGIEWIGEIPKHWEVDRLKNLVNYNEETLKETTNKSYRFKYIDIGSVEYGRGLLPLEIMTFEKAPSRARRIVKGGDIIISTVRTYLKAIALVPESDLPIIASTGFITLRTKGIVDQEYLKYVVQSETFISEISSKSVGVNYPAINATELVNIKIVIPKKEERLKIIRHLDKKTKSIDEAIESKQKQLEVLEEYKKSLIYEYVTGKKEVL